MASEDPEAAALLEERREALERPADAEWPEWSGYIQRAWVDLKYDRSYGAMGGASPIPYSAYSRYAEDHGISIDDFEMFLEFMSALDTVYLAWLAEQQKNQQQEQSQSTEAPPQQ